MPARIPLILGGGDFGDADKRGRVTDPAVAQQFLDYMVEHGHIGVDTSRIYCKGSSEKLIAQLDFRGKARVDTKVHPQQPGDHAPARLQELFTTSRDTLGGHKIRVFYLHAPDRSVPFEDTLAAADALHKAGHFEQLGLSNYMAWEVAEIAGICARRGFVPPTVYQGVYNLLDRRVEDELFPCLRKHGIAYAAYSPLAGGFLTDRFFVPAPGGDVPLQKFDLRYTPSWYQDRYYPMAAAVAELLGVVKAHGLTLTEVAYRWLEWHSMLRPGDHGIVMAASRLEQVEGSVADCDKGPLPEAVVEACEEAWRKSKALAKPYWL
ncbi:aldo/keto reductase [Phanerochaete sordida]|uniref:Aldo/keto reductase n=1 Tax=Phanerochaete sordida TaxID=48140 RepID=A0A9P3GCK6_9APHY|nr:aldo/keto reductase [Phanerochaete sordida]